MVRRLVVNESTKWHAVAVEGLAFVACFVGRFALLIGGDSGRITGVHWYRLGKKPGWKLKSCWGGSEARPAATGIT